MSRAVLTIDDIASENTKAIVDYLCEKHIKAVLFAVGENVEKYFDEAVYALQKGMLIGNHSYSHPSFSKLSLGEGIAEIEKNEAVLARLYEKAGVERSVKVFRFPYGDKGGGNHKALQAYLREHGFSKLSDAQVTFPWYLENGMHGDVDTFWTFDFGEWQIREGSGFTADSVFARIHDSEAASGESPLKEGSRHILLLHAHDETEALLPEYYRIFLDCLLESGVEFEEPLFEHAKGAGEPAKTKRMADSGEAEKPACGGTQSCAKTEEGKARLQKALGELRRWTAELCRQAGKSAAYEEQFFQGLCSSGGLLSEFAYYHDTQEFLCKKKVAGYTVADIMVWQVDHFKAYLDRGEECLRYDGAGLLLAAFSIMMEMEKNPAPYMEKMKRESGTDSPEAFY